MLTAIWPNPGLRSPRRGDAPGTSTKPRLVHSSDTKNRKSVLAILSLRINQMAYWLIILYIYVGTGRTKGRTANVNVRYFSTFHSEESEGY